MNVEYLFPTLLAIEQLEDVDFSKVKSEIETNFAKIDRYFTSDSWGDNLHTTHKNTNCIVSDCNLNITKSFIDPVIKELATKLDLSNNVKLKSSWINITTQYGFQEIHMHSMQTLSGVLYLDVPEDSGFIEFYPQMWEMSFKKPKVYTPKAGRILAFHGSVLHRVTYNKTKKNRISLSFDYTY